MCRALDCGPLHVKPRCRRKSGKGEAAVLFLRYYGIQVQDEIGNQHQLRALGIDMRD
jgi:hypothetical protein